MTKEEQVSAALEVESNLIFALIVSRFPPLGIPLFAWFVKWFLREILHKPTTEGVLFLQFRAIDLEQYTKAHTYESVKAALQLAIDRGLDASSVDADFDDAFRDAIRLKP